MAKNKREIDRESKQAEIEVAATNLFIEHGYELTSMAMIAANADVAPNTLYWYYKNKDDVLVAVLNRLVIDGVTQFQSQQHLSITEQWLWIIEYFETTKSLVSTVHSRLEQSSIIRDWHTRFHQMLDGLLVAQLMQHNIDSSQAKIMTIISTFVVEGLLSHSHSFEHRKEVLSWLTKVMFDTDNTLGL